MALQGLKDIHGVIVAVPPTDDPGVVEWAPGVTILQCNDVRAIGYYMDAVGDDVEITIEGRLTAGAVSSAWYELFKADKVHDAAPVAAMLAASTDYECFNEFRVLWEGASGDVEASTVGIVIRRNN
jgi:hypothetical protein